MVLTPPRLVEMANFFSVKNHLRCRSNHIFSRKEFHSFDTSLHFANVGLSTNRNICSARWCSPGFEMKCWILRLCSSDFIVRWSKWRCLLFTFTLFDNFILTNDASWLMLLPYLVMPAKHDKKRARVAKEVGCKPIGGPTCLAIVSQQIPYKDFAKHL